MKNRILYSILAFLLLSNVSGMAQIRLTETIHDGKTLIMMTPQYLMVNQLRLEIDRKISDRHWITVAPHYVQDFQQYQTHSGFGLVATYKFLYGKSSYFGAGAQFTNHTFDNYAKDGELDLWLYQTKITQYGLNATVGHYFRLASHLFGDIYGGIGYRFSNTTSSDGIMHSFDNPFFSINYSGPMIVVGVRVGVML